ncbi:hypothetical protein APASM_5389 [Actinosynnema pretiosum subsp. pretiosum]|nr:hypothetical protein APASM_5389 [Actinosynnema pretiosum subsp. pretiosum]
MDVEHSEPQRATVPHSVTAHDGTALPATEAGAGDVLLLCSEWPDELTGLAELLAPRLRVIRCAVRPEHAERDAEAAREHFALDTMSLLGHGSGAAVALRYALARPERVEALVCVPDGEPEFPPGCADLEPPTLLVEGGEPTEWAEKLSDEAPSVRRVVLPDAGSPPWTRSPGAFGWAVLAHLRVD